MTDPKGQLVVPCGYTPTGLLRSLPLDASDRLDVSIGAVPAIITVDGASPSIFRPVSKFGKYDNPSLPAGLSNQDCVTVPANEYWRFTTSSVWYTGTVAGVQLYPYVLRAAVYYYYGTILPVVSDVVYIQNVSIILNPSDILGVQVIGATLNDDLHFRSFAERIY